MTWHRGSIVCCDRLVAAFGDAGCTVGATAIRRAGSDAYCEHFPIDRGYSERRDLYNLYHLLNHANLFGHVYAAEAQQVIERLHAQLHRKWGSRNLNKGFQLQPGARRG